jgi:hypothetical protein
MLQDDSKIHWGLYEKKYPVRLWQKKVVLQHFILPRFQILLSSMTLGWGHLGEWNVAGQLQNPLRIIWEKVPSSAMAEQGRPATFHSPKVPITTVVHDTRLRLPRGMEYYRTTPKSIEDYTRKSAQFGYGKTRSSYNISFLRDTKYYCRPRH